MKLEIENNQLANCINILNKIKLGGLPSIYKTRLIKKLEDFLMRAAEEQKEIQKQFFEVDENGEPILEDEKCKDLEEYRKTIIDFVTEKAVIDDGDSQVMLRSVKSSLEKSEVEWEPEEAFIFEYLYTALEDAEGDTSEEVEETAEQ